MYRGTWLLVALPLLIVASKLSVCGLKPYSFILSVSQRLAPWAPDVPGARFG